MFAILPYPPRKTFGEVHRAITCVERRVVRADLEEEVDLLKIVNCSTIAQSGLQLLISQSMPRDFTARTYNLVLFLKIRVLVTR
jgi:hypothetical protein